MMNTEKPGIEKISLVGLQQFTGSENWYRYSRSSLLRHLTYTDGVRYVAMNAGAYWLIDEIMLPQVYEPLVKEEIFQVWTLIVDLTTSTGILTCEDGNSNILIEKSIPYTDFPLEKITFYFCNNVLHLPSEN